MNPYTPEEIKVKKAAEKKAAKKELKENHQKGDKVAEEYARALGYE